MQEARESHWWSVERLQRRAECNFTWRARAWSNFLLEEMGGRGFGITHNLLQHPSGAMLN